MNEYQDMKIRQQKEINSFDLGAAFSRSQFKEMMNKWGYDEKNDLDKILSIGYGCFIRKEDRDVFFGMFERHKKEMNEMMSNDKTGDGFCKDMFIYELQNHEYGYTRELGETLDSLGYKLSYIRKNKKLSNALDKAIEYINKKEEEDEEDC